MLGLDKETSEALGRAIKFYFKDGFNRKMEDVNNSNDSLIITESIIERLNSKELNDKDYDFLSKVIEYYYLCYIWRVLIKQDCEKASDEDYLMRNIFRKHDSKIKISENVRRGL